MFRFTFQLLTLALLWLALAASPSAAQGSAARPLVETVDVRVVNLEAVVIDGRGRRVAGLGPQDFRLRVDRREVPIEYFSEIAGGVTAATLGESSAGRTASVPGLIAGRPAGTSYLVFIDD